MVRDVIARFLVGEGFVFDVGDAPEAFLGDFRDERAVRGVDDCVEVVPAEVADGVDYLLLDDQRWKGWRLGFYLRCLR